MFPALTPFTAALYTAGDGCILKPIHCSQLLHQPSSQRTHPITSCCIAGSDVHCILLSATPFDRVSGLAYLQFVFKSGVGWGMYRALASRKYHHIRKKWCYPYSCTRLFTTKNHTSSKSFQTRATIGVQG